MELLALNWLGTIGQATIWLTAGSTYASGRPSLQEAFLSLVDAEDQICV